MTNLDLRAQRCPLALLLAKRHVVAMASGEECAILVKDPSSKSDILRFLSQHGFQVECVELNNYFSLNVMKGTE
ncbi:sulfurtransferase TusA family protein [Vibrio scophthalmi]|uniref:sulfurtransferase TusA family protein n=1 Tax=Vibrio scophthalmi TaxID=45658 RepID=UPI0022844835|nr:sulfurtransferase TusA family protein [Vibrio scophthalmi]MCY9802234.1 sulfurtransferase TusA family protein [Vibrio scophthalmi]